MSRSPGKEILADLDRWLATPRGGFVLARQRRLLERLLADWPRRGPTLLEVGCGAGLFLETFWRAGFDCTAMEHDPLLLQAARSRLGDRVECRLAAWDHLPWPDRQFDVVVMTGAPPAREAIAEAVRVCAGAVLVAHGNHLSWAGARRGLTPSRDRSRLDLAGGLPPGTPWGWTWNTLARLRKAAPRGDVHLRATLHLPPMLWTPHRPWRQASDLVEFLGLGAWAVLRLDRHPQRGMTPLLQLSAPLRSPLRSPHCATF